MFSETALRGQNYKNFIHFSSLNRNYSFPVIQYAIFYFNHGVKEEFTLNTGDNQKKIL